MKKLLFVLLLLSAPAWGEDVGSPGFYFFTGKMYHTVDTLGISGWYCEYYEEGFERTTRWIFFADSVFKTEV